MSSWLRRMKISTRIALAFGLAIPVLLWIVGTEFYRSWINYQNSQVATAQTTAANDLIGGVYNILIERQAVNSALQKEGVADANTVKEFIAYAQSKPGSVNFATLGPNTSTDLSRRWLGELWKADMAGIPYKGGPQVFTAIASGESDATWMGVYGALSLLKAGKVKLFAVNGSKRLPAWPDVPTLKELGADDMPSAQSWWGLLTGANVPDPIVRRLNGEIVKLFARKGAIVVNICHRMNLVREISDRVAFLRNGQLIEEGPVAEVFGQPRSPELKLFLACS